MSFSESLFWFKEPGFVGILFICFLSAFFISAKASKGIQIFISAYCTVYIITQWSKGDHFSMGLWWMYCGWAGFLFHKLGGMALLGGIGHIMQNKFESMGRDTPQQNPSPQPNHNTQQQAYSTNTQRESSFYENQDAYHQREQQREKERRQEQEQAEEKQRQDKTRKKSTYEEKPPSRSKPKPDPEPAREDPPPPKPKTNKKRLWWEVLGVPSNADKATIKKAYRQLIQKYHPDRVSHLGEEFQVIAEEKTKEINSAFCEAKK